MLDYHLHLWPHDESEVPLSLERIAAYCERAVSVGVSEIALTEHLFRFTQAKDRLGGFWDTDEPSPALGASMAAYFDHHAHADLDAYVELALAAKDAGLPVVVGLGVDYYRGRMDEVAALLSGYPFDVLLGSVHWIGAWRFDDVDDALSMAEWSTRRVDDCWDAYTEALEELADSGVCDVLAHPDLIKVASRVPGNPGEWWDRIAEAAAATNMAAELSSAGWRKPCGEQYPASGLLERLVERQVAFTTASDAHHLAHVADRSGDLRALLDDAGITTLRAFSRRVGRSVPVGVPADLGAKEA